MSAHVQCQQRHPASPSSSEPLLAVGSGSAYAYSVLDAGYRTDLSVPEAADLAERAVRTAATRDAFSGGFVNVYFADRTSGTWRRLRRAATS